MNNKRNCLQWFSRLSVLVFTIIISLFLAEGLLCLKNSSMKNYDIEMWKYAKQLKKISDNKMVGHEHIPNTKAVLQSVEIRTNALGLRGEEWKPNHKFSRTILFLGSSITLGWGVSENDTVTSRVQQLLRQKNQSVQVLNGGIGNYNAVRYVEHFMTALKETHPTDIVIHAFVRDAEPILSQNSHFLLKHSQLAVTLWTAFHRVFDKKGETNLAGHYQQYYDQKSDSFKAMQHAYQQLSQYAKKNKIRVYMVMTPDIHNLKQYPLTFIHEAMENIARENGFIYLDLLPEFAGLDAKTIWAMPGDPHPNAYGHQLMSHAIAKLLMQKAS